MDSKFYVSYEAARLLKEKGYPFVWGYDSIHPKKVSKAEAIDWLESKGIYVATSFTYSGKWLCTIYSLNRDEMVSTLDLQTRLEAEEAAIIKACELL